MKELAEDAEQEKALKDVAEATAKEKTKAATTREKKAIASEKARVSAEKKSLELEAELGIIELKLVEGASLNTVQVEELAKLKATLEACENKWYNERFVDMENSIKPVIQEARNLALDKGWLATLQALGVPKDSPLRNPNQIPLPGPSTAAQNPPDATNEGDTLSMRELVEPIDSYMDLVDLEVISNLCAGDQPGEDVQLQPHLTTQQPIETAIQMQPVDPTSLLPSRIFTVYFNFLFLK